MKVILGEEVALQHQSLVCDMLIKRGEEHKHKFKPRLKIWKPKDTKETRKKQEQTI